MSLHGFPRSAKSCWGFNPHCAFLVSCQILRLLSTSPPSHRHLSDRCFLSDHVLPPPGEPPAPPHPPSSSGPLCSVLLLLISHLSASCLLACWSLQVHFRFTSPKTPLHTHHPCSLVLQGYGMCPSHHLQFSPVHSDVRYFRKSLEKARSSKSFWLKPKLGLDMSVRL